MRLCRVGVTCGCAVWVYRVGVSCGCVMWVCHVGVLCGCAVLSSTEKEASVLRKSFGTERKKKF